MEMMTRRLLIVDDEAEIRQAYQEFLTPAEEAPIVSSRLVRSVLRKSAESLSTGYELVGAASGDEALARFKADFEKGLRFAGAFVDVRMPGALDGIEFIREAWKIDPNLLVVVATAYHDKSVEEIDRLFTERFQDQWDYINKPFTSSEVIQKARQMVSSWNRRRREEDYLAKIQEQQATLIKQERLAAVGRLAQSVGHEFGNVLQPLIAKLEQLQGTFDPSRDQERSGMVEEMIEAAMLGSSICQDLLLFSRERGADQPLRRFALAESIEGALRLLRHELKRRDIRVVKEIADDAARLTLSGHPQRMLQVFVNLSLNALQAMAPGGQLQLSLKQESGRLLAQVKDTGSGISPSVLERVFEPLFTTKPTGNGLGLSVCKEIITQHGGTIQIRSAQGRGTTVEIDLPADSNKASG